jgi:hypothetical protein
MLGENDNSTGKINRRDMLKTAVSVAGFAGMSTRGVGLDGSGTAQDPFVITSAEDLREMAANPGGSFVLESDVDASGVGDSRGFVPIENFAGEFDGRGNEIRNLRINRNNENAVGLFGSTESSATIRNVGVVGVEIVGNNNTGGLVGLNRGTIDQCYTSGQLEGTGRNCGGLVGSHRENTIIESFSTVTLDATNARDTGGFVGDHRNQATIRDCYATGDVNAVSGGGNIGGFAGENDGTIETSLSVGTISGDDVGGFTGEGGTETNCY